MTSSRLTRLLLLSGIGGGGGEGEEREGWGGELVVGGEGEEGGEAIDTHSGEEGCPSSRLQLRKSRLRLRKARWCSNLVL